MASGFRPANQSRTAGRRALFLVTLLAIFIVLLNIALAGALSTLIRNVVSPVSRLGGSVGSAIADSGYFSSRRSLEAQVAALQDELQQQQLAAAAFSALQQQNQSLASLEHLAQTSPGLAAPVISSIVSSPYGTFMVGAGSADNVAQNALILTSNGFVVGKVVQVSSNQSLVNEIFGPGTQTSVTIDGASVIASGQGGQAMAQVPRGVTITQGDPVVAPEYGGRPIGVVQHVESDPADALQQVYIALPVSLSSLQYVYVTP